MTDTLPVVCKADGHCSRCNSRYHGERYCLHCCTGDNSTVLLTGL
ncbi:UNVERIFIED_ORG: hypothetical protein M2414_004122 [Rahnella aquatilis]